MAGPRIARQLTLVAENDLPKGAEVDVWKMCNLIYRRTGKTKWGSNEISGAMSSMSETFMKTDERNENNLVVFVNMKGSNYKK